MNNLTYNFTQNKANTMSFAKRKLVCGVGINDADYLTYANIGGKQLRCPYYNKWRSMIERCFLAEFQARQSTYIGCTVCKEWLTFSVFRAWMTKQNWQGMELDKDLKIKGNKVYSPDSCIFVPNALNVLFIDRKAARGAYPVGVSWDKCSSKFKVNISYSGKRTHLGLFTTSEEASKVYQKARKEKIQSIIDNNIYPMATQYLQQHI